MAEQSSGFVTPSGWFPAPELTPTLGPLGDTAPLPNNWVAWAMLPPPPPPPASSPSAAGPEPSSTAQPPREAQVLPEAPPPFDTQILPGAQPPFDAKFPLDSQPQLNGQPSWNFQASTSWYWGQPSSIFPRHQESPNAPGRLLLLSGSLFYLPSPLLPGSFLSPLLILLCTLTVWSLSLIICPTGVLSLPVHSV